MGTKITTRF